MKAAGREADLAVINPSGIFGPLLDEDPGTSALLVNRLLDGSMPAAPRFNFAVIDVRDVAAAHVAALTAPSAGGHRFPMGERTLSIKEFADILRRRFPAYAAQAAALRTAGLGGAALRAVRRATCAAISASSAWCGGWIRATSSRCSGAT